MSAVKKRKPEITLSTPYLEGVDLLLSDGLYESQAEIVKDALRRLFNHYEIHAISDACYN